MEKYMYEHIISMGEESFMQMPNNIFNDLSMNIKSFQQLSFAYTYLVLIAFLYRYANYVCIDNKTYIQNKDIKKILGYDSTTKSIDKVIKKNGILDQIGLTETTKDYPVSIAKDAQTDTIDINTIRELCTSIEYSNIFKNIVKNRNYEIKVPMFLFNYHNNEGTLTNWENTYRVTLKEFIHIIYGNEQHATGIFYLYSFFKSQCYGLKNNTKAISYEIIYSHTGIVIDTYYSYLEKLIECGYIKANKRGWQNQQRLKGNSNEYQFIGVK